MVPLPRFGYATGDIKTVNFSDDTYLIKKNLDHRLSVKWMCISPVVGETGRGGVGGWGRPVNETLRTGVGRGQR